MKRFYTLERSSIDSMRPSAEALKEYERKYNGYDAVYLSVDKLIEDNVSESNTTKRGYRYYNELWTMHRTKYLVLNPENTRLGTFTKDVGKSQLLFSAYAIVSGPDGTVQTYNTSDFAVTETSDGKQYKFAYPRIVKGSIIEEGWEYVEASGSYSDKVYALQYDMPCEKVRLRLAENFSMTDHIPKLHIKQIAREGKVPVEIVSANDEHQWLCTYQAQDVPGIKDEPFAPYFMDCAMYFQAYRDRSRVWNRLSDKYASFTDKEELSPESEVGVLAKSIISNCKTDYERVDTIVTWIQNNLTVLYVGDEATDQYRKEEIDYKALVRDHKGVPVAILGFTKRLLQYAGIKSNMLIVHDGRQGYFDSTYVSRDQFSQLGLELVIGDSTFVVFPTIASLPAMYVPQYLVDQPAMRMTREGFAFVTVPRSSRTTQSVREKYEVQVRDDGTIAVKESKFLTGSAAFDARSALKDMTKDELDNAVKRMLTYSDGIVKVTNYTIHNLGDAHKPLQIDLAYSIDNLVTLTPDEAIIQTGGLFAPSSEAKERVEANERKNPIRIYYDNTFEKDITINYPPKWQLTTTLTDVNQTNSLGSITAKYVATDGTLSIKQVRYLQRASEPKEKIGDLITLIGKKSKLQVPTLAFKINASR